MAKLGMLDGTLCRHKWFLQITLVQLSQFLRRRLPGRRLGCDRTGVAGDCALVGVLFFGSGDFCLKDMRM